MLFCRMQKNEIFWPWVIKMKIKTTSCFALLKRYGLCGFLRLFFDLILTKIYFPGARILRRPFFIRGKNSVIIGKGFTSGVGLRIDAFSLTEAKIVQIGENVEVNDYVHIGAVCSVKIGNNVLIASRVFISDHSHGDYSGAEQSSPDESPSDREICARPVEIEDNVWIGEGVAILPGVKIGRGAIIGANSVVTCSVPPETIFAGIPARKIKEFDRKIGKWIKVQAK